jgi:hypothetical protein
VNDIGFSFILSRKLFFLISLNFLTVLGPFLRPLPFFLFYFYFFDLFCVGSVVTPWCLSYFRSLHYAVSTAIHDGILLWGPPVDRSIDLVHTIIATTADCQTVIVVVSTTRGQGRWDIHRAERGPSSRVILLLKGRRNKRQDPPWPVLYSTPRWD